MEQPPGYQSANLWWPDDHAWCVATDIDFSWTYLAGTEALADELTNHPKLEVIRTRLDHRITYDADTLNPPPEWQRRSPDLGPVTHTSPSGGYRHFEDWCSGIVSVRLS